ncbi:MAG: response regulator [Allosphingosinicella sp.]|uniref:response regulator n=1 Tax=Allosphingosinicella sp. TaxID=2823234 RepID=UPI003960A09E
MTQAQPCDDNAPELAVRAWDDGASVTPDQLKVLIVDDDEMMHRLVSRALTSFGFTRIESAENGAAGIAAVEREAPDIIISDYYMPEMNGLDFVEAVRGDEGRDQIVIIMLSAHDDRNVIEGARDLGADTFMVKPFHRDDLKQLIDTLYHRFNNARIAWPQ